MWQQQAGQTTALILPPMHLRHFIAQQRLMPLSRKIRYRSCQLMLHVGIHAGFLRKKVKRIFRSTGFHNTLFRLAAGPASIFFLGAPVTIIGAHVVMTSLPTTPILTRKADLSPPAYASFGIEIR